MLGLLLSTALLGAMPESADVVVVCPEVYRAALAPWVTHREAQGHKLTFVAPKPSSDELRTQVKEAAVGGKVKFVVLVGDHEKSLIDAKVAARALPACIVPA